VEPIPAALIVDYASSRTVLSSAVTLHRAVLETTAGYELAGGATSSARALMPLVAGPFAEARVVYSAARTDDVATRILAADDAFSSGQEARLVQMDETWQRRWSRLTEMRLGVGASVAGTRASSRAATVADLYPVVAAALEKRAVGGARLDVTLEARLGPTVNRLFGTVDERVEGTILAAHAYRRFTARAFATASQLVAGQREFATSIAAGEIGGSYAADRFVAIDVGLRVFWQRVYGVPAGVLQSTMAVGVSLRTARARL
jgi:hypothetical protein